MADPVYDNHSSGKQGISQKSSSPEVRLPSIAHANFKRKDPKVAVIREEFVALTGDPFIAVVLSQLLYWTQRVKDFGHFLEEERGLNPNRDASPCYGWIYKTANELIEETMLCISRFTIRRYLGFLVENGWLYERADPADKWDKTMQYRINLQKIRVDLSALGYTPFEEFYLLKEIDEPSKVQIAPSKEQTELSNIKNCSFECASANIRESKNAPSNVENCSFRYLNRDYTKSTNREHTQNARACKEQNFCIQKRDSDVERPGSILEEMLTLWKRHVGQDATMTRERKRHLHSILSLYFQANIQEWERFCERIRSSPFLMGEGARKWRITLDWVLDKANLCKVLEGNFDDPKHSESKTSSHPGGGESPKVQTSRDKQLSEILASIKDPQWREWCSQLDLSPHSRNFVSLGELEGISNARFLEVEDERLVWIGSPDKRVLDCIENLRLKLFSIIERTFPNTRTLRTRLCEEPTLTQHMESNPISAHFPDPQHHQGETHHAE